MSTRLEKKFHRDKGGDRPAGGRRSGRAKPKNIIVESIHKAYDTLSNGERLVADLVLDSPGELSVYPASELARLAGVSNSTITRFVRRTGFRSYDDMRLAARDARSWGSPLFQAATAFGTADSASDDFLVSFAEHETANLGQALAGLSRDEVDEISKALVAARNLAFLGFRNSYFLASYARSQFLRFRDGTRMIPGPGETVAERIADLGPKDVVVVVGLRRIVGALQRHMAALAARDVRILLITDPSVRVIPAYAHWTVICPVENPHVFDSYSGVLAVLRVLAYESFRLSGKKGREYMERIEAQHETLEEFE